MLASATEGADPRPFGIDDLLLQPQNDSPDGSPWAPARDQSGCATDTVTGATGEAEPCHVGGHFDLLDPCVYRNRLFHVLLCSRRNLLARVKIARGWALAIYHNRMI